MDPKQIGINYCNSHYRLQGIILLAQLIISVHNLSKMLKQLVDFSVYNHLLFNYILYVCYSILLMKSL